MEALHAWHEFYLLLGTAGATLLALLFVAVSLGTGFLNAKDQSGTRTFMSPVVIHFTIACSLSPRYVSCRHTVRFSSRC